MSKTKKKLPKRIAGVKIPKELRAAGGALLEKADSPAGREMLAAGLAMLATGAAAAATAAAQKHRAAPRAGVAPTPPVPPEAPDAPSRPGEPGLGDPQALADAIGNAADAVLTRLFGAKRPL